MEQQNSEMLVRDEIGSDRAIEHTVVPRQDHGLSMDSFCFFVLSVLDVSEPFFWEFQYLKDDLQEHILFDKWMKALPNKFEVMHSMSLSDDWVDWAQRDDCERWALWEWEESTTTIARPRSLIHHESNGGELTHLTNDGGNIVSSNKSCIVIQHLENKNTIETRKRKCRTDLGENLPTGVTEFHNGKKHCSIQYGGGMAHLYASNQRSMDPINSGRNGGSGEQCDNVVTHSQEKSVLEILRRPKCKNGIQISLQDIQQHGEMKLIDAAQCLKVSRSTLKRICREFGIDKWRKIKKNNHSLSIEFVQGVDQEQILKSSSNVPSTQASAIVAHTKLPDTVMQETNMVSIKAKYVNDIIIRFELSFPYKLVELQQQVAKRLNLEAGTYYIKYKDEDNDLILIACDDDLERLCTCRLQGSSSIEVFLQPK